MVSIVNEIPKEDLELMDYWRRQCCDANPSDFIPTAQLLEKSWGYAKRDLFTLLGGLKISKDIEFSKSKEQIEQTYEDEMRSNSLKHSPKQFILSYNTWADKYAKSYGEAHDLSEYSIMDLAYALKVRISKEYVISNELSPSRNKAANEITMPDGKIFKITSGIKTLRYLSKIAKAFKLAGFEEFRIWQSILTSDRKIKGKLTLSIHPMDFMTMSDNDSNWSTCMSWGYEHIGDYRYGTIEMMNSPKVVMAYVESENDMDICGYSWNNKKWRSLFIVDDSVLVNVKAYPYQSTDIVCEVLNWLRDLARDHWGWHYDNDELVPYNTDFVKFSTDTMYNDFSDEIVPRFMYYRDDVPVDYINYSGELQCMVCGELNVKIYENDLLCSDCDRTVICDECNERINIDEANQVDDEFLCDSCFDNYAYFCDICAENRLEDNMTFVTIVNEDGCEVASLALCNDCIDQFEIDENNCIYVEQLSDEVRKVFGI